MTFLLVPIMKFKLPYGTTVDNNGLILPVGQCVIDTERKALRLHDGVTLGGIELAGRLAYAPPSEYMTLQVAGDIGVLVPNGHQYAYSADKENWTSVTSDQEVQTIPATGSVLYIKPLSNFTPDTWFYIGRGNFEGDPLANNLRGVVGWWNQNINLRLGCYSTHNFQVPLHAPPTQTNMIYMFVYAHAFNQNIGSWDVTNVTSMASMFDSARTFNQDLSSWYVPLIASEPGNFDQGATAWTLPRPQWGVSPP